MSKLLRFQFAPLYGALPRGLRATFDALTFVAPAGIIAGEVFDWLPAAVAAQAGKSERQVRSDMLALQAVGYVVRVAGRVCIPLRAGLQPLRRVKRRLSAAMVDLVGSAAAVLRKCGGSFGGVIPSSETLFSVRERGKIKEGFPSEVSSVSAGAALSDRGRLSLEERRAQAAALLPLLALQSAMNGAGSS